MRKLLKTLQEFQEQYPNSQVGGSVGLWLLGYELDRDLSNSDLDIICEEYVPIEGTNPFFVTPEMFAKRNKSEGPVQFEATEARNGVLIEINSIKEEEPIEIKYEGVVYKVSPFENILKYKIRYASNDHQKHFQDIVNLINK